MEYMERKDILQRVLHSFEQYYDVKAGEEPFAAEAEFHSHTEQYLLIRAARVADIDSHEYVFFVEEENLTTDRLELLVKAAWDKGISKVHPCPGHRSSDIALIIIADTIEDSALRQISCIKYSKSYRFSLWGWSSLRLMAYEVSSGRISCNRLGRSLKNLVSTKGKK